MAHEVKIYCFIAGEGFLGPHSVVVVALAQDGTGLASHMSSDAEWGKHDIGITSEWKHDLYRERYPDGYDLEWVDSPDEHAGVKEAIGRNQLQAETDEKAAVLSAE